MEPTVGSPARDRAETVVGYVAEMLALGFTRLEIVWEGGRWYCTAAPGNVKSVRGMFITADHPTDLEAALDRLRERARKVVADALGRARALGEALCEGSVSTGKPA